MGPLKRLVVASAIVALTLALGIRARTLASSSAPAQSIPKPPELRIDVDLVLIPVTVLDKGGHHVTNLQKEHFQLWEDKIEQKIANVSNEDVPVSLGIILDSSASMDGSLRDASRNVNGCLRFGTTLTDEFFLVLFSSRAQPATEFTTDIRILEKMTLFLQAKGRTALYDAVYNGIARVKEGKNPRKALVIASDGGENSSRHGAGELKEMIKELDVQVYTIGNEDDGAIRELTQLTGGKALTGGGFGSIGNICAEIVRELKSQYIVGYRSSNREKDGKMRNVLVKINPRAGLSNLSVRYKRQYFVPKEN